MKIMIWYKSLLITALLFALAGCGMLLGIEERVLVADAGEDTAPVSCESYCSLALENCTGPDAVYASAEACLGVCAYLELGANGDVSVDTVGCRQRNASLAGATGEVKEYCPYAGPGGEESCGSSCGTYCSLMKEACPEYFVDDEFCQQECQTVPDHGNFSVQVPYEHSIQCRLYHLSTSTIDNTHCEHAAGFAKCVPTFSE